MKMWSTTARHQTLSSRPSNMFHRVLAMFLIIGMIGGSFGGVVSAADEIVTEVYLTPDQQSGKLYVDDNSIILNAYAQIDKVNAARNVTEDATWSSTSTSVKVVKGVITASGAVSSATITAKYKDKSDTFIVTSEYYYDDVKLKTSSGVDAPDKQDITLGKVLNLSARGVKGSTVNDDITSNAQWTTSNSAVATVSEGKVTLLTAGTVTITVKYKGKSSNIVLTVTTPYSTIDIMDSVSGKVIDGPIDLYVDAVRTLKAQANLKAGGTEAITESEIWTSSNAKVAKIDENGKMTAVGAGTAVITAKRYGISASVTVIVRTEFEALKVTPDKPVYFTLNSSGVDLTAVALSGLEDPKDVSLLAEWKISDADQAVAVIEKSSSKVNVVPKGAGSASISVSYKGLTKTISVTVFPTITTVEFAKDSLDVFVEDTAALPAVTGKTLAGDSKDISKLVKWTSDNTKAVTVEDGKWKAVAVGKATLTAEVDNVKSTIVVEVHNKILALVASSDNISVVIGKEVTLPTVTLLYENGLEEPITDKVAWKSSTANLLVKEKTMRGLLSATATLTGTYLGKTVKVKVTVEEEYVSFEIAPTKISLTLNKSQTIKVTGTTKSGKKVSLGSRIDWEASTPEHMTIKGASAKALVEGSGKLTATIQGKSLELPYVITAKLSKLTASVTSVSSAIGEQTSISLTSLYENGKSLSATTQAVWTTSKATVATVDDGRITAKGKGTATIKAAFGGKTVTIRVTVK
ncbi:hypothetical protein D7Z26_15705 [Cohnella endophytica]|uniref:BIG2 domain-containing protein n=1 Tax=Cohnella endophytica TaxID=2419778 RepID=A0A494XU22_9BACL|nr:hypothetical protein [Cohnella endophytica]RKP53171.1 hypothetical protein D7Z26_15705 [Cohnella endophytica]